MDEYYRFFGLANYFSDFIEDFAHRCKPLYEVFAGCPVNKKKLKHQKVDVPFFEKKWGEEQRRAWQHVKEDLSSHVILAAPDRYANKLVITDASSYGVGDVLLQERKNGESGWCPIAFASRKLKPPETRYHTA